MNRMTEYSSDACHLEGKAAWDAFGLERTGFARALLTLLEELSLFFVFLRALPDVRGRC